MSGQELALSPVAAENIKNWLDVMRNEAEVSAQENSLNNTFQIISRVFEAEDFDQVFAGQDAGTIASKDFLNVPFLLGEDGIRYQKSNLDAGMPYFAFLSVTRLDTGNDVVLNTGSPSVLAVLHKLGQLGYFEKRGDATGRAGFMFVGKPAANGTVVTIRPVTISVKEESATGGRKK